METLHQLVRGLHIASGGVVIVLLVLQLVSQKGSNVHRLQGRLFYWVGSFVVFTAMFGVVYILGGALAKGVTPEQSPEGFAMFIFLAYLGVITFVTMNRALLALKAQESRSGSWMVTQLVLSGLAALVSLGLILFAATYDPSNSILLFALSPLGLIISVEMIRFGMRSELGSNDWLFEHVTGMVGAGIAFTTAVAVYGASSYTEPLFAGRWYELAPFILPAATGLSIEYYWKKRYRRRIRNNVELNRQAT